MKAYRVRMLRYGSLLDTADNIGLDLCHRLLAATSKKKWPSVPHRMSGSARASDGRPKPEAYDMRVVRPELFL